MGPRGNPVMFLGSNRVGGCHGEFVIVVVTAQSSRREIEVGKAREQEKTGFEERREEEKKLASGRASNGGSS